MILLLISAFCVDIKKCITFYSCSSFHNNWTKESCHHIFNSSWPDIQCSFHSESWEFIPFLCLHLASNQSDVANPSCLDYCNTANSLFGCKVYYCFSSKSQNSSATNDTNVHFTDMGNWMEILMNSPSPRCLSWLVAHWPREDLRMLHLHGKRGLLLPGESRVKWRIMNGSVSFCALQFSNWWIALLLSLGGHAHILPCHKSNSNAF